MRLYCLVQLNVYEPKLISTHPHDWYLQHFPLSWKVRLKVSDGPRWVQIVPLRKKWGAWSIRWVWWYACRLRNNQAVRSLFPSSPHRPETSVQTVPDTPADHQSRPDRETDASLRPSAAFMHHHGYGGTITVCHLTGVFPSTAITGTNHSGSDQVSIRTHACIFTDQSHVYFLQNVTHCPWWRDTDTQSQWSLMFDFQCLKTALFLLCCLFLYLITSSRWLSLTASCGQWTRRTKIKAHCDSVPHILVLVKGWQR